VEAPTGKPGQAEETKYVNRVRTGMALNERVVHEMSIIPIRPAGFGMSGGREL